MTYKWFGIALQNWGLMMSVSEIDDDDDGNCEFLDVFDAFEAAAIEMGWSSNEKDEVLRIRMKTDFGNYTMQVRLTSDDTMVDVSVVYKLTTVAVSEPNLYKIMNQCNGVPQVGTFFYEEKTGALIWRKEHILGDLPGMTLVQVGHIIFYATESVRLMQQKMLAMVNPDSQSLVILTAQTEVMGRAQQKRSRCISRPFMMTLDIRSG